jgi:hypothetical protein
MAASGRYRLFEDRSSRLPRLWSNKVLRQIAPVFRGEVINVSGWNDRDKQGRRYRDYFSGASRYYVSNHGGERGLEDAAGFTDFAIDLEAPVPAELQARFDVVFNHTTLEHVFDMFTAFRNLCAMSRDVVILVLPFAQKMHWTGSFGDYWRFSPQGVRRLFTSAGLTPIYEAANDDRNAALYVIGVGARHPERWRDQLPPYAEVQELGEWLGGPGPVRRTLSSLRQRATRR